MHQHLNSHVCKVSQANTFTQSQSKHEMCCLQPQGHESNVRRCIEVNEKKLAHGIWQKIFVRVKLLKKKKRRNAWGPEQINNLLFVTLYVPCASVTASKKKLHKVEKTMGQIQTFMKQVQLYEVFLL